jgi:hypothetical protein
MKKSGLGHQIFKYVLWLTNMLSYSEFKFYFLNFNQILQVTCTVLSTGKRRTIPVILREELTDHLPINHKVATVLGSIPASSETVESEGRQMKQC